MLQMLIKSGADVNAKSFEGIPPLHIAVLKSGKELVKILIKT